MDKTDLSLITTAKFICLIMAIISVILYAEMYRDYAPWHLLLWLPITFGYFVWFSDVLETHIKLKELKAKIKEYKEKEEK